MDGDLRAKKNGKPIKQSADRRSVPSTRGGDSVLVLEAQLTLTQSSMAIKNSNVNPDLQYSGRQKTSSMKSQRETLHGNGRLERLHGQQKMKTVRIKDTMRSAPLPLRGLADIPEAKLKAEAFWMQGKLHVQVHAPPRFLPPINIERVKGHKGNGTEAKIPIQVELLSDRGLSGGSVKHTKSAPTKKKKPVSKLPIWHWKCPPRLPPLRRQHPVLRTQAVFSPTRCSGSVIRRRAQHTPFETRINPHNFKKISYPVRTYSVSDTESEKASRSSGSSYDEDYSSDYSSDDDTGSDRSKHRSKTDDDKT